MKTLTSAPVTNRTLRSLGHELEVDEHSFGWLEDRRIPATSAPTNPSMSAGSARIPSVTALTPNSGAFANPPRESALKPGGAYSEEQRNSQMLIWLFFLKLI